MPARKKCKKEKYKNNRAPFRSPRFRNGRPVVQVRGIKSVLTLFLGDLECHFVTVIDRGEQFLHFSRRDRSRI